MECVSIKVKEYSKKTYMFKMGIHMKVDIKNISQNGEDKTFLYTFFGIPIFIQQKK